MYTLSVVTGTRADYGLLRPVLAKLLAGGAFEVRLLVTGTHLSADFGRTVSEIEADPFPIAARLDILSAPVPPGREGTARREALALGLFLDEFTAHRPHLLLLLGDRYEAFAAAQAAALLDIPIAHISGGEVTLGADDDWFRHCISKMAKLHFPSCELHRKRLMRMGEQPSMVFNVGGLGDENIRNMELMGKTALGESLGLSLRAPYALVTFHPETATGLDPRRQADMLLSAIERHPELFYLFTAANADAGGEVLNRRFAEYCESHENAVLFQSLGALRYLSAMKHAALVLGNSSSGVVESPSFGTPTVNIGTRQEGRTISQNVLCCPMDEGAIAGAIAESQMPSFQARAREAMSPYDGGNTSGKIVAVLEEILPAGVLEAPKIFYDGEVPG